MDINTIVYSVVFLEMFACYKGGGSGEVCMLSGGILITSTMTR